MCCKKKRKQRGLGGPERQAWGTSRVSQGGHVTPTEKAVVFEGKLARVGGISNRLWRKDSRQTEEPREGP